MMSKKAFCYILIPSMIAAVATSFELVNRDFEPGPMVAANTTADGQYTVTTNNNHAVVLWDFKHEQVTLISKHASHYTAHFSNHGSTIEWRDNILKRNHQYNLS